MMLDVFIQISSKLKQNFCLYQEIIARIENSETFNYVSLLF